MSQYALNLISMILTLLLTLTLWFVSRRVEQGELIIDFGPAAPVSAQAPSTDASVPARHDEWQANH